MFAFPSSIFVTGTDTNVGKTVVSGILTAGLQARYWKPIQSGRSGETDTAWVRRMTALPDKHFIEEAYLFSQPLSPHHAAAIDGVSVSLGEIRLPAGNGVSHTVIEGAGGVLVPLNGQHLMIDLMKQLSAPVIVVAHSGLGTINHTLLTLSELRRQCLEIVGVILNGPKNLANKEVIEQFGKVKVLAEVEPIAELNQANLSRTFSQCFGTPGNDR